LHLDKGRWIDVHLSNSFLRNPFNIGQATINLGDSWNLILGIAFVVGVLLLPQGISGVWQRWRRGQKRSRGIFPTGIAAFIRLSPYSADGK